MIEFTQEYDAHRLADASHPIWVVELMFAGGEHGIEGQSDVYLSNAPASAIVNFPYPERWFPVLDLKGSSSIEHRINHDHGVATIGSLNFKVRDIERRISDTIRAADLVGHGFGQQLCQVYRLYENMDWLNRARISTQRTASSSLDKSGAFYMLRTADIQTRLDQNVFEPYTTVLSTALGLSDPTMTFGDANNFNLSPNATYGTCGLVQIDEEIVMWTAAAGQTLTIPGNGRGMFGTTVATHDAGADVVEVCAMHENPITMALKIMCSTGTWTPTQAGDNGTYDVLPKHWGCGLKPGSDIDIAEWEMLAQQIAGLDDPAQLTQGMQYELVIDKAENAKLFLERQIFRPMAAYGYVRADGMYSARAISDATDSDRQFAVATLTADDLVDWGDLEFDDKAIVNQIRIKHYEWPKLTGKLKRKPLFINQTSIDKNQARESVTIENWLVRPEAQYVDRFYQSVHRLFSSRADEVVRLSITTLERDHHLDIGDAIVVQLPLYNRKTGANLDRAFRIVGKGMNLHSGKSKVKLEALPSFIGHWAGDNVPPIAIAAAAFRNKGTQINWDGLGGSQTLGSGLTKTLNNQDYWVDGDLILDFGSTIINKGARIFVNGLFRNRGHIDGIGRGPAGGAGVQWTNPTPNPIPGGPHQNGNPGGNGGGWGKGGRGGRIWYQHGQISSAYIGMPVSQWVVSPIYSAFATGWRAASGWALTSTPPSRIDIYPGSVDGNGIWQSILGLPVNWSGSGGGSGRVVKFQWAKSGAGGDAGADLIIIAKDGIYCTEGTIDCRGTDAPATPGGYLYNVYDPFNGNLTQTWITTGGGGGGGGSVGLFTARNPYGLEVLDVDELKIQTDGGVGVAGDPTDPFYGSNTSLWKGEDGLPGIIRTQVIG